MTKLRSDTLHPIAPVDTGWLAQLNLTAQKKLDKTIISHRHQYGPLTIQRPFYPEGSPCHLYLLHPPGGVAGGDRLEFNLLLQPESHVVVTMPGATKFYRSAANTAHLIQQFDVKSHATIEWLPQLNILFDHAKAKIQTIFNLQAESCLIGWDSTCFGRPTINEKFTHGQLISRLIINPANEQGLEEGLNISNGNHQAIANYAYSAMFFAYPADTNLVNIVRNIIADADFPIGLTCLDRLLVVRLLTNDNQICQDYLIKLWQAVRPILLGLPSDLPRIWMT